jgi:transcriptional regulator with XRE-family HTH domain
MTQQQLADLSTISTRAIRDLERGRAQAPRNDTVRLLADALRIEGRARATFESSARRQRPNFGMSWEGIGDEMMPSSAPLDADVASHDFPWSPAGLMSSTMKYEYKTLRLFGGPHPAAAESWADTLNEEAKCGWRLVTVDDSVAILERCITDAHSESASTSAYFRP